MADVNDAMLKVLQNVHQKTLFQENEEQIKDLEKGVKEIIKKIIDVFYSDSKYVFEELIHVGSSYEGTKIMTPNEFDFMLVLKSLSEPGKVYIDPGCQPGMKLIRYKQFKRSDSTGPNLVLNNMLGIEIDSVMTNSEDKRRKQKDIRVKTSLGELKIRNMLRYTLHLDCTDEEKSFDIKVDLMPCVRLPYHFEEIKKDMAMCPSDIRGLAFKDGCFLVGKFCVIDGMCWQLSFAAAERNMMKSLSSGHKKIYRVLKYLFVEKSLIGICDLMSSYILKTAVLRHAYFHCEENKPTECFVAILRSLALSMGLAYMKSLFLPSLNLWQKVIHEKMRNITENDIICDKSARSQLKPIISIEGEGIQDALTITVIFEFWKRIFLLLADIFESTDNGEMSLNTMERSLRAIYTKLNEEDEEDDIETDYFKQEAIGVTALLEDDWKISRSMADVNVVSANKSDTLQFFEKIIVNDDENDTNQTKQVYEVADKAEEQSQDLKDIEQFVNNYVKEVDEYIDSDDESSGETNDCNEDDNQVSDDEMFVQAEQEVVYEIYDKYKANISVVDIPVFSALLQRISMIETCKTIQTIIVEKLSSEGTTTDVTEQFTDIKRPKLSAD